MMAFTTICKTQRTLYFELSTSQALTGLTGAAWMLLSTVVSSCAVYVKLSSSSCPPGTSFGPFTAKAPGAFGTRSRGVIITFVLAWLLLTTFSFAAEAMVGRIVVVVVGCGRLN
jgi:hypothetical protein